MTDDLILIRLVLVFFNKIRRAGESDLVDVLLHLVRRHADTVVDKCKRLFLRIDNDLNLRLVIIRQRVLAHHIQLL